MWWALGPIYCELAFIADAAVPNLSGISGIASSLLILDFTYTFHAILYFGFHTQLGVMIPGEGFDPHTGATTRHDTGMEGWVRGYFKNWPLAISNTRRRVCWLWNGLLGGYRGGNLHFGPGGSVATSFGCAPPA